MKRVYLVRHGESEGNVVGFRQGHDTALTLDGHTQAQILSKRMAKSNFDLIVSSDMHRALESAQYLGKKIKIPVDINPLLREIRHPKSTYGLNKFKTTAIYEKQKALQLENIHNPNFHLEDEENYFETRARARNLLSYFVSLEVEKVVAFSHGSMIRIVVEQVLLGLVTLPTIGLSITESLYSSNTGITIIEYLDHKWRLISYNDHAHLW